MTDHRVTDLAIGQLGQATYDAEEQEWKFSQSLIEEVNIKQLLPFKEWISPSNQIPSQGVERASLIVLSQTRWLSKTLPETFSARSIASNLVRGSHDLSAQVLTDLGSLLAVGRAHDPDRVSGLRKPQIIGMPCGVAGHILQLIKPRIETRGWGKSSGARLSILNIDSLDTGHWMGTGGTILQILSADSENDKDCWLAVRQTAVVTLFRPQYGRIQTNPVAATGQPNFAPSMLNANPVASLSAQRTGSKSYSDITFNPWFSRQIAVVDTHGYWSIWEADVRISRSLIPRNTGGIYDGKIRDDMSKPVVHDHFDGWYRIIWVASLSTILVCNRRYISIYDIEGKATPLGQLDIFPPGNNDWILDIQRSAADMDHLYILTTSRIFWIQISSAGEKSGDQNEAGGKVVLSYIHYMSPDDETLKLNPLQSDNVSVAITSAKNRVVNYYTFRKPQPRAFASSRGTFSLMSSDKDGGQALQLHTVRFLPCHLVPSASQVSGPGPSYMENGVEFFQIWAVTSDLGLFSTLTSVARTGNRKLDIIAPDTKLLLSSRAIGPRFVQEDDDFIVPDDQDSHISRRTKVRSAGDAVALVSEKDDLRFRLNWRRIFKKVFPDGISNEGLSIDGLVADMAPGLSQLLGAVPDHIRQRRERDEPFLIKLAEIVDATKEGDDIEEASTALRAFIGSLREDQSSEDRWRLSVVDLTMGTEIQFPRKREHSDPDLLAIFDHLVDNWMASLPLELSNITRHAKFKVIRQLAMDLCLNSIGISLQDRALDRRPGVVRKDAETVAASSFSKDGRLTRESSPFMFSSHLATIQNEPGLTLPTPTQTPSLYSQTTSATDVVEDAAIARLRQYAPTIKAKPESTANANEVVLSHWPSALADPAEYSYEDAKKAWAATNTDEHDARSSSRKEKARRRRRTEEFVKAVEPAVSRRSTLVSGSQPEAIGNMYSSQPGNDVPMTQPDRGTFGSRTTQQAKKKPKKQRTAGFK
ncbi:hypothetical protein VTL71DRAFT_10678 [Oculimacula yallundae]|uniref:RNA polymerase I-specific transcription initiation factor RRN6-like protein n=1 Tax=Oculimacula yallundae TaxID=86028 RepID=A0ABR4CWA9_9HELO